MFLHNALIIMFIQVPVDFVSKSDPVQDINDEEKKSKHQKAMELRF